MTRKYSLKRVFNTVHTDDKQMLTAPGDFYGGWVTSELEGPMKGGPGTWGW
jgi:hypothetical protein